MSDAVATSVAALPAVALADLVEEAELLARVDRKYVVGVDEIPALVGAMSSGTRVLQIGERRSFSYRSTYLDTPGLESFLTSGRSRRHRWKVRSRSYVDTGANWLEVKTAGPRGRTLKQRIEVPALDIAGLPGEGAGLVTRVVGAGVASRLRPVLDTSYRRTTLLLPGVSARVTIDTDLAWTSTSNRRALRRPFLAIVETKTGSTPSTFDRLLWARGHRPVRISKYGVGMAALHPDLPHLKWHHVLERHLGVTSPRDTRTAPTPTDRPAHQSAPQQRSHP